MAIEVVVMCTFCCHGWGCSAYKTEGCYACCCCCFCCWYCPPVREVFLNYEVVEFQPQTFTTLDLGSVTYCYVHLLARPTLPSCCPMSNLPHRILLSCLHTGSSAHPGDICTRPIIPIKIRPLPPLTCHCQILTLPPLSRPHHACQIPVASAPSLL